jgi:two-component system response regulator PilR (NtrC family)
VPVIRILKHWYNKVAFRQDLFFRIHVMDIVLPPLRERGQDILLLANHFIQKCVPRMGNSSQILSERAQTFLLHNIFQVMFVNYVI